MFLTKKKYQLTDETIESSLKTRVRGVAIVKTSDDEQDLWGPEDYVVPQQVSHFMATLALYKHFLLKTFNKQLCMDIWSDLWSFALLKEQFA